MTTHRESSDLICDWYRVTVFLRTQGNVSNFFLVFLPLFIYYSERMIQFGLYNPLRSFRWSPHTRYTPRVSDIKGSGSPYTTILPMVVVILHVTVEKTRPVRTSTLSANILTRVIVGNPTSWGFMISSLSSRISGLRSSGVTSILSIPSSS